MHEPPPCTEPAVFSSRRRKMMRATSHSEITSIAPSSASPAAAAAYYVQSPSRDSHDEIDKYSSSSPLESPSDPRHSMGSSSSTAGSRISGNRRRWNKHYCNVVAEDGGGAYGDDENEYENPWPSKCLMFVVAFGLCFAGICLVIWGASTHYKPQVTIKVWFSFLSMISKFDEFVIMDLKSHDFVEVKSWKPIFRGRVGPDRSPDPVDHSELFDKFGDLQSCYIFRYPCCLRRCWSHVLTGHCCNWSGQRIQNTS